MNVLSLCTGGGGLDLGVKLSVPTATPVAYCERDACALEVLAARMEDGSLEEAPVWFDLATLDGGALAGRVDIVVAGYPCQPDSLAGDRLGLDDERWLWHHVWRVVREVGSRYLFVENVPGHLSGTFGRVLGDLAEGGWSAEWDCVPAASVGAPHIRDRVFMLAADPVAVRRDSWPEDEAAGRRPTARGGDRSRDPAPSDSNGGRRKGERVGGLRHRASAQRGDVDGRARASTANAGLERLEGSGRGKEGNRRRSFVRTPGGESHRWADRCAPEPTLRGVDDGLARQVDRDRLFVLGNGVVPQAAARAWRVLWARLHGGA